MKLKLSFIITIPIFFWQIIICPNQAHAQNEQVRQGLKMIAEGKIDEVKIQLPDLLAEFPDDPGVQLLHGAVIEDGHKAVEKYENIITNYPNSEWADDAYWRIVQFYAIVGDTTQALLHLNSYRKRYPASEYLIPAADAVKTSLFQLRKNSSERIYSEIKLGEPPMMKEEQTGEEEEDEIMEIPPKKSENDTKASLITEKSPIPSKENITKGKFGLQVGIYSTYEAATAEVERFQGLRMLAEIKQKKIGNETMYAVVIGDYTTKNSAENAKNIVQQQCKCIPIIFEK